MQMRVRRQPPCARLIHTAKVLQSFAANVVAFSGVTPTLYRPFCFHTLSLP